jgi:AcrR family transcriptional regulator
LSKGQITRNNIVERARQIFNEKGLDITLDTIALEMGLTKGRITNHFPTKDSLFQAIMGYYEWQLGEFLKHFNWPTNGPNLQSQALLISGVMDIQYENRCGVTYISLITAEQTQLHEHIMQTYRRNVQGIRARLAIMVEKGLLKKEILKGKPNQVFIFQYVNLLTTWVTSAQHYYIDMGYGSFKPVFLEGVMQTYLPYLTEEGLKQYAQLNFTRIAKGS